MNNALMEAPSLQPSFLGNLPQEVTMMLLAEWLPVKEQACLDTAMSHRSERPIFLTMLIGAPRRPVYLLSWESMPSRNFFRWAGMRGVSIGSMRCSQQLLNNGYLDFEVETSDMSQIVIDVGLLEFLPLLNSCTALYTVTCCSVVFSQIRPEILQEVNNVEIGCGFIDEEEPNVECLRESLLLLVTHCTALYELRLPLVDAVSVVLIYLVKNCETLSSLQFKCHNISTLEGVSTNIHHQLSSLLVHVSFDVAPHLPQLLTVADEVAAAWDISSVDIRQAAGHRTFRLHNYWSTLHWKDFLLSFRDINILQIIGSAFRLDDEVMAAIINHSSHSLRAVHLGKRGISAESLKLLVSTTSGSLTSLTLSDTSYSDDMVRIAFNGRSTVIEELVMYCEPSQETIAVLRRACPRLSRLVTGIPMSQRTHNL